MKGNKVNSEREKAAAPPDFIPAIFGWMSMEEQEEHAKEITNFTKKLKPKIKKHQ